MSGFVDANQTYFLSDVETDRPDFSLSISHSEMTVSDELVITGIPAGTLVTYLGGTETVNDGSFNWSTASAGEYPFKLELFPYRLEELVLIVTDT